MPLKMNHVHQLNFTVSIVLFHNATHAGAGKTPRKPVPTSDYAATRCDPTRSHGPEILAAPSASISMMHTLSKASAFGVTSTMFVKLIGVIARIQVEHKFQAEHSIARLRAVWNDDVLLRSSHSDAQKRKHSSW